MATTRGSACCSIMYCNNRASDKVGKSFYRFPKDTAQCSEWVRMCHRKGLDEIFKRHGTECMYRSYHICSDHFATSCFMNPNNKSRGLIPRSIPSLNCDNSTAKGEQTTKQGGPKKRLRSPSPDSCVTLPPLEQISKEPIGTSAKKQLRSPSPDSCVTLPPLEQISEEPIGNVLPDARLPKMTLARFTAMKRNLKIARITMKRQQQRILHLRKVNAELKKASKLRSCTLLSDGSVSEKQFILGQLLNCNALNRGQRYSDYYKNFALALYYCSPKCYQFLRKILNLPTVRSLNKWLENIEVKPGFPICQSCTKAFVD